MGVIAFFWSWWLVKSVVIAFIIGVSLVIISTLATTTGTFLPFLFKALKIDPALTSSPFITTVVDIVGIVVYLGVAAFILLR
ncbi:MAG: Magnesium transporter MgtE [candidate division WS2 bacterium]|nr:Magnesium transporter MgtE [Candidatus Lithacetigena glycinireducens]